MWWEKLEHLMTPGMILSRKREWKKMINALTKWLYAGQMTEAVIKKRGRNYLSLLHTMALYYECLSQAEKKAITKVITYSNVKFLKSWYLVYDYDITFFKTFQTVQKQLLCLLFKFCFYRLYSSLSLFTINLDRTCISDVIVLQRT